MNLINELESDGSLHTIATALDYAVFDAWSGANADQLASLVYRSPGQGQSAEPAADAVVACRTYHAFQAFYIAFRRNHLEITTLKRAYRVYEPILATHLIEEAYACADLDTIVDNEHACAVVSEMRALATEIAPKCALDTLVRALLPALPAMLSDPGVSKPRLARTLLDLSRQGAGIKTISLINDCLRRTECDYSNIDHVRFWVQAHSVVADALHEWSQIGSWVRRDACVEGPDLTRLVVSASAIGVWVRHAPEETFPDVLWWITSALLHRKHKRIYQDLITHTQHLYSRAAMRRDGPSFRRYVWDVLEAFRSRLRTGVVGATQKAWGTLLNDIGCEEGLQPHKPVLSSELFDDICEMESSAVGLFSPALT